MKKFFAIALALAMVFSFAPISSAALFEDNSTNYENENEQDQAQGQLQGQAQGQLQGQAQAAIAAQGQMQGNLNKNDGNQGQADVNIRYEDRFQIPSHSSFAAPAGTETAQMSIGGLTLSDTAPHVVAQAKMQILQMALEGGLVDKEFAQDQVLTMIDNLNIQTTPKRIFSYGPRTSGKHLFNLFGIIATDSWRGNKKAEEVSEVPAT